MAKSYDRLVDNEISTAPERTVNAHVNRIYDTEPVGPYVNETMMCRICFDEGTDRDDFTVPCLCAGGNKYIHKSCLNRWRATNGNPRAFTHCPTCGFEYHIEEIVSERPVEGNVCGCVRAKTCSRKNRFRLMVSRDFLVGFLLLQTWLISLAVIIRLCDPHEHLVELFPVDNADRSDLKNALYHHKTTYYFAAIVVSFFLVGVYACFCSQDAICDGNADCGDSCRNRHCLCPDCWYCYCGECNCDCFGAGAGSASEECAAVFLVIAVIIALIFVFVGIFFGIMAIVAWIQRIWQRHLHILHKQELAREFVVVDLEKAGRLRYAVPENGPEPSAPSQIQISTGNEFAQASAPPPEHFEASRNLGELLPSPSWW